MDPVLARLVDQVRGARVANGHFRIVGGGSKDFFGNALQGEPLDVRPLAGISSYEPTELVVTVRAGTPLADLEAALAEKGQHLPFEPPRLGSASTVGGMIAAGLAGPARAAVGSVRDHLLGATLLNGKAEVLSFGGQVMKNVAGYDVSRVLAGSMGTLGVICEVSLKVLPQPTATATLRFEMDQVQALEALNTWGAEPLPISASAWWDHTLVVRLAGARAAVEAASQAFGKLGGESIEPTLASSFWQGLRDQRDEYFASALKAVEGGATLWRLGLPQTAEPIALPGEQLVEWGGAQRWLCTPVSATQVRDAAGAAGGHATLFRSRDKTVEAFHPLSAPLARFHCELKKAFDPDRVFNRGRMVPDL